MLRTIKCFLFLLTFCFLHFNLSGQTRKIDSLKALIKTDQIDTNKIQHLYLLGKKFVYNNPDTAFIIYSELLSLCEKLSASTNEAIAKTAKMGKGNALGEIGIYYRVKADYVKALEFYNQALQYDQGINYKQGAALCQSNLGAVYADQGEYPQAMEHYFNFLKMAEQLDNKGYLAIALGNIGVVYDEQGDPKKALEYYFKALKIDEELGLNAHIAAWLGDIGTSYYNISVSIKNDPAERNKFFNLGLDYYFKAMKMDEKLGNKNQIGAWLTNIGSLYKEQAEFPEATVEERKQGFTKALDYSFKALKMNEELGNQYNVSAILGNIASIYTKAPELSLIYSSKEPKQGFALAAEYAYRSIGISIAIEATDLSKSNYRILSTLYEKSNVLLPDTLGGRMLNKEEMRLRALYYYKNFQNLKDTIFSQENKKQLVQKEMNFEFQKKEAATQAEQDKRDSLMAEEKQRQKIILYSVSAGLFLVLLLALFIFRGYKEKQKANNIITKQKEEVELQKHIVEEKQKEIIDSIRYARRIQRSLLPPEKYIDKSLKRLNKQS